MLFKFKPILKQTLWGGSKIIPFKHLDCDIPNVGESWEISGVRGNETVIDGGPCDGVRLDALIRTLGADLLGAANYRRFGDEFPLLIKFIDARQDLSIQVHPNDEVARRQGQTRGKTEMWYLMESDPDASLYCGLKEKITPAQYRAMVADGTICDALARYHVRADDAFFIPAGRIHAIGEGCFLAEIQQTSDVTWRIYDYNRTDKDGLPRPLHTPQAAESIDYNVEKDYRARYLPRKNERARLVSCPWFNTAVFDIDKPLTLDYSRLDSFVILIAVEGEATISGSEEGDTSLRAGETILVPATQTELHVNGKIKFLETFV